MLYLYKFEKIYNKQLSIFYNFIMQKNKQKQIYQGSQQDKKSLKKQQQHKITDFFQVSQKKQKQKSQHIQQKKQKSVNSQISCKTQPLKKILFNYLFYSNQYKSIPNGDLIDNIHKNWSDNYKLLQQHHGYIQWIFPNKYKSRFNSFSHAIDQQQIEPFFKNQEIYTRYIKSYEMMLKFYGMKLKNKNTGQLVRTRKPDYKKRYEQTLLTRYHNHMRITRILSSLCLLGFSQYALKLVNFLKFQIFDLDGQLNKLQRIGIYERQWQQFEKIDINKSKQSDFFKSQKKMKAKL